MNVFTTGFDFGGLGPAGPVLTDSPLIADITNDTLTFSLFDFTLFFEGGTENLSPASSIESTVTPLDDNTFGVIVQAIQQVNEPAGSAHGFLVNWRLEGVMTTTAVPLPPTAWLFATGLMGLVEFSRRNRKKRAKP